jgi:hypothetical protein
MLTPDSDEKPKTSFNLNQAIFFPFELYLPLRGTTRSQQGMSTGRTLFPTRCLCTQGTTSVEGFSFLVNGCYLLPTATNFKGRLQSYYVLVSRQRQTRRACVSGAQGDCWSMTCTSRPRNACSPNKPSLSWGIAFPHLGW